jgi:NADH:ubiquinone oxidoreductase subunit F (NADH-binding)/NADH:ubiquinone oxidoreductase subunit E
LVESAREYILMRSPIPESVMAAWTQPPLLTALASLQRKEGHLSGEALTRLARGLGVPAYELYGLASFFPHFRLPAAAGPRVRICRDLSCALAGSQGLLAEAQGAARRVGLRDTVPEACPCLGRCDAAPAAEVDGRIYTGLTGESLALILRALKEGRPRPSSPPAGVRSAERLCPYRGKREAFGVLRSLLRRGDPKQVIGVLEESGLRGMGGAGFPAGRKWAIVRGAPGGEKFAVCNADESEPGTFKDRALLDSFPELVLEGLLIAAWAVGARVAIVYIRHEYERQRRSLMGALRAARAAGLAGGKKGPAVHIFVSPGGYICGEETALLEVLEDKRAQPRDKPPFPGTHGLHGRPTLIQNVETLALVPAILRWGAAWYASFGKNGGRGFKFLGISGPVRQPGVYEVELGTPIRSLIEETAGGLRGGRPLKAFSPGGASSGFLPAPMADLPYDFRPLAEAGSMLGSGALVAIPEGENMAALAHNALRFFRDESCGKCVPCRLGTAKLTAFLERALVSGARAGEIPVLEEAAIVMADTSICGLGQAAPLPFLSLLKHFRAELDAMLVPGGDGHGG